ncbi:MAG: adenylate kinase [Bacilli bacterium]|nr:adenylate kinase [Bacilli bacterium]
MNLILFGAPGAGKGTQASEIVRKYKLTHISTGEMFRSAIAKKTAMGELANSYISKGCLVPDDITVEIVKERLAQEDCKNGFILDGFPRTLHQAECLEGILLELNIKIDYVIDIEVDTDKVIERLTGRRVCRSCGTSYHVMFNKPRVENICDVCGGELYTRKDDNVESVAVRLKTYQEQTKPLIDYYTKKGILLDINGQQEINDVFKEIVSKLGE